MKTTVHKGTYTDHRWFVVDAEGEVLGRLATRIATVLRGKHKPLFSPHIDMGDHVVVVNAEKVRLTGQKLRNKVYVHHSGHPGGLKSETAQKLLARKPEKVIERAVWGMLPHNRLGRRLFTKLKVYRGGTHPHAAQQPAALAP